MDEKERILRLVSDKTITVQEGLELLEKLGPGATGIIVPVRKKKKEDTYNDMVERLVENTIKDLLTPDEDEKLSDLDRIEEIAKKYEFTYGSVSGGVVKATREELIKTAKYVVKCAIENLFDRASQSETTEDQEGRCATGRFECVAWFDDYQVEVELKFVPFTAFGCSSECDVAPEIMLEKRKKLD